MAHADVRRRGPEEERWPSRDQVESMTGVGHESEVNDMSQTISRRGLLQGSGLVAGGALLAARGTSPRSAVASKIQGDPVSIRYLFPAGGGPTEEQVYEDLLDTFMEANPDIRVEPVHPTGDQGILDLLTIELAAGEAADVTWLDIGSVPAFAANGGLIPLDDFVTAESYDLSDFFPTQFVEGGRYDGVLYGLPRELNCVVTFFNADLFAEAGLETPYDLQQKGEWTWQKFIEVGQALTDKDARRFGTQGFDNHPWRLHFLARENGAAMVTEDLTQVTLNDPKAIEAYQFAIDLMWKHGIQPEPGSFEEAPTTLFASRSVATMFAGRWVVPTYQTIQDFTWGTALPPAGPAGTFTPLVGAYHCITKDSEHPEEAWRLVKYMSSPEAQARAAELGLLIPVRRSVAESPTFLEQAGMEPRYNQVFLDAVEDHGTLLPINENWIRFGDIWVAEAAGA